MAAPVLLGQLPPTQTGHSSHHTCDKLPENKIRKLITSIWVENDGQDADWRREACLADNFRHITLMVAILVAAGSGTGSP